MIRFFASSHRLDQLRPRTLGLLALFLLGVTAQAVSGIAMHHMGPGWTPRSIRLHYRGEPGTVSGSVPAVLESPFGESAAPAAPDEPLGPIQVPRSLGTLLEVAHFHLVAMPLILLVVAHLFAMTRAGASRWAGLVSYGSFACAGLDIAAPFAVRYLSGGLALGKLLAFVGLHGCLLTMTLWTLAATVRAFFARDPGTRPGPDAAAGA